MECPVCKEQIKEGAAKCPVCGEILAPGRKMGRFFVAFVSGTFSVAVALASLGVAYLEYQGRVEAVEEKEVAQAETQMAEAEKEAAEEILRKIDPQDLQAAVQETQFDFSQELQRNPQNLKSQQQLFYTESFLRQ